MRDTNLRCRVHLPDPRKLIGHVGSYLYQHRFKHWFITNGLQIGIYFKGVSVDLHAGLTLLLQTKIDPSRVKRNAIFSKNWSQRTAQYSMQKAAVTGSDYGANQHPGHGNPTHSSFLQAIQRS